MKEAQAKDAKCELEERRALRFDIGEGLLELGLVLSSLYFLARKNFFPIFGVAVRDRRNRHGSRGLDALRRGLAIYWAAGALALLGPLTAAQTRRAGGPAPDQLARIEARSADLLAVGTVHGDRLTIHLSRIIDNAPVRNCRGDGRTARDSASRDRRGRRQLLDRNAGFEPAGSGVGAIASRPRRRDRGTAGDFAYRRCGGTRRGQEWRTSARLVGPQFRRVHRNSLPLAPAQGAKILEALECLHQELEFFDAGGIAQRKCEIDVHYVAEAAARIAQAQSKADVAQQARVAVADRLRCPTFCPRRRRRRRRRAPTETGTNR